MSTRPGATTYPILRGWRRVRRGWTHDGDMAWGFNRWNDHGEWVPLRIVGMAVWSYWCVIRRVKGGGK